MLVAARVVQGLGAAMMTPQTMAVITRTFAPERRGSAMALWGATAGVATLVGPILGGVLLDGPGWEWIFFINVPVGIIGFVLAARLVPRLATHAHSFDWVGVALSAVGLFCAVFAIQEGHAYDWGVIRGPISVPLLLGLGVALLGIFLWWQSRIRTEPLVPLRLFRDRNFSVSNLAITTVAFTITAVMFPFMIYAQSVRGLSPTRAALLLAPQALMSIVLAPIAGRLTDRMHPRALAGFGLLMLSVVTFALARVMNPDLLDPLDPDRRPFPGRRQLLRMGPARRLRQSQPPDGVGRRRLRRLQHDPAGRGGPRQCGDRRAHGGSPQSLSARHAAELLFERPRHQARRPG